MSKAKKAWSNGLTTAQVERLALLAEEAGELVHVIGKALRHGLTSSDPTQRGAPTNIMLIERELGDIDYAVSLLYTNGDIALSSVNAACREARKKKPKWLHHQDPRALP